MTSIDDIRQKLPTIIVGVIGHVSDGKSTITLSLSGKKTQKYSSELVNGMTIVLGYANVKIFKCLLCPDPKCYKSGSSSVYEMWCDHCGASMDLVSHISFVDCPGHHKLTSTMLSGTCVMDYTILVESVTNPKLPAAQTWEHLTATQLAGIENAVICLNKVDTLKFSSRVGGKELLTEKINELKNFTSKFDNCSDMIIPTSAIFGINMDILLSKLASLKEKPRVLAGVPKMIAIRSFDINAPKKITDKSKLKGGVMGGSVIQGKIAVDTDVLIYPGYSECVEEKEFTYKIKTIGKNGKKKKIEKTVKYQDWKYYPVQGKIISIKSETENVDIAIPGGLVGIQLDIDPSLTRQNKMIGNLVTPFEATNQSDIIVTYKLVMTIDTPFPSQDGTMRDTNFEAGEDATVHINSKELKGIVRKHKDNMICIYLKEPVAVYTSAVAVLSRTDNMSGAPIIVAKCSVVDSAPCEML
jgi:translation initiation factor 2 subunit 3